MASYEAVLSELYGRQNRGIKLGLSVMQQLLGALGRPDHAMRHVVIAGTNGKGSTSAFLAAALREAGHRVGHFTSPHLLRFTERIRIDDHELPCAEVEQLWERVARAEAACERSPTFFELVTAMALLAFAEAGVQIAVLEVGLGGRLDATNVVDKLLAVITPVALDHQALLGDTLTQIAAEKAGIIPPRGLVVFGRQPPEARAELLRAAFRAAARHVDAPEATAEGVSLRLAAPGFTPLVLPSSGRAAYLRANLATAAAAARALHDMGVSCPDDAVARGARASCWPGRYQWLSSDGVDVLLDGGHNPAALQALRRELAQDSRAAGRPCHVVFTVLADRPAAEMLAALGDVATSWHLCPVSSTRSRSIDELATLAHRARVHARSEVALSAASSAARADGGFVLVTGSLFLVADALALLTGARRDPPIDG